MRRFTAVVAAAWIGVQASAAQAASKSPGFPHKAAEAGRWSLLIAAVALVIVLPLLLWLIGLIFGGIGHVSSGDDPKPKQKGISLFGIIRGAVVGADGRVSTSKTIAVTWTYAVASGLLSIVVAKWLGHGHAYGDQVKTGLQGGYAVLIGGPIGAAILSKGIVSSQVSNGTSKPSSSTAAQPSQLVTNDQGETDLGDLQYLLFNTVALVFFFGQFIASPQNGLPTIPDVLLGLTSVSTVGYVAKKALTSGSLTIAKISPASVAAGANAELYVSGLADAQGNVPDRTQVSVRVGDTVAPVQSTVETGEGPVVDITVPDGTATGTYDVTVTYQSQQAAKAAGLTIT